MENLIVLITWNFVARLTVKFDFSMVGRLLWRPGLQVTIPPAGYASRRAGIQQDLSSRTVPKDSIQTRYIPKCLAQIRIESRMLNCTHNLKIVVQIFCERNNFAFSGLLVGCLGTQFDEYKFSNAELQAALGPTPPLCGIYHLPPMQHI